MGTLKLEHVLPFQPCNNLIKVLFGKFRMAESEVFNWYKSYHPVDTWENVLLNVFATHTSFILRGLSQKELRGLV